IIEDDRDAIIKVTSCAICGSDLHLFDHFMPGMKKGVIMGHETRARPQRLPAWSTSGTRRGTGFGDAARHRRLTPAALGSGSARRRIAESWEQLTKAPVLHTRTVAILFLVNPDPQPG